MRLRKTLLTILVLVPALAGGYYVTLKRPVKYTEHQPSKESFPVLSGRVTSKVSFYGSVNPPQSVVLKSRTSGIVSRVLVAPGGSVRKGEALIEIDTSNVELRIQELQRALEEALLRLSEAEVVSNDVAVKFAEVERDRRASLVEAGLLSASELDKSELEVTLARQQLSQNALAAKARRAQAEAARARLQQAIAERGYGTIEAPIDGVVLDLNVTPGSPVAALGSVEGGTELLELASTDHLEIVSNVSSADSAHIRVGMAADVQVTGSRSRISGTVSYVSRRATLDDTSDRISFKVTVALKPPTQSLRFGESANVSVLLSTEQYKQTVPTRCVHYSSTGEPYLLHSAGRRPIAVLAVSQDVAAITGTQIGAIALDCKARDVGRD